MFGRAIFTEKFHNSTRDSEIRDGELVEIISQNGFLYKIRFADGTIYTAFPAELNFRY